MKQESIITSASTNITTSPNGGNRCPFSSGKASRSESFDWGYANKSFSSESNPPDFIWKASEEREQAMAKIRRDENVEQNQGVAVEMTELLQKFCDLHAA
jgi:hypothetical protein